MRRNRLAVQRTTHEVVGKASLARRQPGEMVITSIYAVDYVCDAIFVRLARL